jgi:hypothetical protein
MPLTAPLVARVVAHVRARRVSGIDAPRVRRAAAVLAGLALPLTGASAQAGAPTRSRSASASVTPALPTEGGQAAFATIQEIARMLNADPKTNWSTVNLEALRLHLVDMDLVTLSSRVVSTNVPGGAEFTVRGTPNVAAALKRMTGAHLALVEQEGGPKIVRTELPDGVRLLVTARTPTDATAAAKIRGLGFIGLMTSSDHHQMHHLMMARGDATMSHGR